MEPVLFEEPDYVESNKERFIKLIVGTAAGFIASRAAEHFVDSIFERRRGIRL